MTDRTIVTIYFSLCVILLMVAGILGADGPTNSSQTSSDGASNNEKSSIEKGMDVLYYMTNGFLDTVQSKKLYEQSWLSISELVEGDFSSLQASEWQTITSYWIGYSVCLAVGILFAIIMPIVGCCLCCCRCANRCGGRRKERDPKNAKCKRTSYCTVLLIINTISLAGVVCAFVTNDIFHRKVENENNNGPIGNINKALTNLQGYVNNTANFLEVSVLDKYDSAAQDITTAINTTADKAVDEVLSLVNATSNLNNAYALSNKANIILQDLTDIDNTLINLKNHGQNLSQELTTLKSQVQTACIGSDCSSLNLNQYNTDANFSKLEDFSSQINSVKDSINISKYVTEAEKSIDEVKANATNDIRNSIDQASKTMTDIRREVKNGMDGYKDSIISGTKALSDFKGTVDSHEDDVKEIGNYIWYAGIGISCVFLLIILFYYLGVLFGACGERPGRGAACCNTGVGGNFLMAGVAFSFIFSWLLMIVCFVMFIPGGIMYTEVCRYFISHDPQLLKPFDEQIMKGLDLGKELFNKDNVNISIVDILEDCKKNESAYKSFSLDNLFDLDQLVNLSMINKEIEKIATSTVTFNQITILTPQLKQELQSLASANLQNINFDEYNAEIQKNITVVDLSLLSAELRSYAQNQPAARRPIFTGFADKLDELDQSYVDPMEADVRILDAKLKDLEKNSNVKNETDALINGLTDAENKFNSEGVQKVNDMLRSVVDSVNRTLQSKTEEVKNIIRNDAGRCRTLFDTIYMLTDSACVVMLNPLNGFWFSMGWCLFFFIPSIIFAVKLSTLYHREDDYVHEKDFDDANFSMYAGPSPDTIPLTSSGQMHERGYGAQNNGYHSDGYKGHSGYQQHAHNRPPSYDDGYHRGERNGRLGQPIRY